MFPLKYLGSHPRLSDNLICHAPLASHPDSKGYLLHLGETLPSDVTKQPAIKAIKCLGLSLKKYLLLWPQRQLNSWRKLRWKLSWLNWPWTVLSLLIDTRVSHHHGPVFLLMKKNPAYIYLSPIHGLDKCTTAIFTKILLWWLGWYFFFPHYQRNLKRQQTL